MLTIESSLLSTLVALAAAFLSFSVAVQIFQELWKFLTSSKSRAYRQALEDFLGPWASDFLRLNGQTALRGPFQVFRFKPGREFLPLNKEALTAGLEKTAPPWVQRGREAIELEITLQNGIPQRPSPVWGRFLKELSAGSASAGDVQEFLDEWRPVKRGSVKTSFDARQLRTVFRHRFYRDVDAAVANFPAFARNFEYYYKRRNMRQSFTIALVFAFFFNLPFDVLYRKASAVSPGEAAALAQQAMALYEKSSSDTTRSAEKATLLVQASQAVAGTLQPEGVNYVLDLGTLRSLWNGGLEALVRHILGLLITALFASFGAPVWNDLTSALVRVQKTTRGREPA